MYISNIDHQKVQELTALVNVMPGQIVSRTLAQNKAVSITVFAFDKGTKSAPTNPPVTPWCRCWRAQAASPWMARNTLCIRVKCW